ncbi:MAG: hypothetical protein J6S23_01950 [Clostridia bacterium]|nr:hypothetical protein [Clostridia bacterium]
MIESVKICAIGIASAILCVLIKNARNEFLLPSRLSAVIIIFSFVIILITPIFNFLKNNLGGVLPLEHMKILAKALGIAYMTHISSELCRECGESNIAFGIESAGKIEIIILSLPLINQIIEISREMISW